MDELAKIRDLHQRQRGYVTDLLQLIGGQIEKRPHICQAALRQMPTEVLEHLAMGLAHYAFKISAEVRWQGTEIEAFQVER